ncbi:MAG TPA: homoserine dehydrogenase [Candidatus Baltobacteraceae bacterium]|jgi:homoserine dehydrogenase|nr:homoserine dehydrogenase [Candidatus Baltobacteraceae bacterium]
MRMTIGIGLIGCGTVGAAVAQRLLDEDHVAKRCGVSIELRAIATRTKRDRQGIPAELFTNDPYAIVNDPRIDIVVECAGGCSETADYVEAALVRGAHVVTANKDLIATQGPRLHALAHASRSTLTYEASVCGAIPVLRVVRDSLAGDRIHSIAGVINGTTTAILSAMENGDEFPDALAQAQKRGYAEADPSNDVDGIDAAHKLAVLMQLAFGAAVTTQMLPVCGISQISRRDAARARTLGYRVRLIAAASRSAEGFVAGVSPQFVHDDHPFAQTSGPQNVVQIRSEDSGEITLCGPGAGGAATASAVIADVIHAARTIAQATDVARAMRPALTAAGRIEPYFSAPLRVWGEERAA